MLERTTIYVDTSYLLASFYNSWEEGAREQLEVSLANVVQTLNQVARGQVNQQVHRQFWYDGVPEGGPHRYQRTLRVIDGVILRSGQLIEWGNRRSQKAVDTRLVADMVIHAFRGQCTDMVLVSGDADMIPGVEAAVEAGVRVHLVGFGWDSVSSALRNACDSTTVLDPRTDFADSMQIRVLEGPLPPQVKSPRPAMPGDATGVDADEAVEIDEEDFRDERAKDDSVAEVRQRLHTDREAAGHDATAPGGDGGKHSGDEGEKSPGGDGGKHSGDDSAAKHPVRAAGGVPDDPSTSAEAPATGGPAGSRSPAGGTARRGASDPGTGRSGAPGEPATADDPAAVSQPASERHPGRGSDVADSDRALSAADACPMDERDDHEEEPDTRPVDRSEERSHSGGRLDGETGTASGDHASDDGHPNDGFGEDSMVDVPGSPAGTSGAASPVDPGDGEGQATLRVTRTQVTVTQMAEEAEAPAPRGSRRSPRPNPSMMAARRRPVRSRYVPLSEEVWSTDGDPTPYDVGRQYAAWWYRKAADEEQRSAAHMLTGGALPAEIDRPLLQFACQTLHEFTLNEYQRVALRDGFHEGIRALLMR